MRISDWSSDVCSSDLGRQHLVEVVARVEPADDEDLDQRAGGGGGQEAAAEAEPEGAGLPRDPGAEEGAGHVERAVRQVDEAHDAEHQREAGGHEEQHDAELHAVEKLLYEEGGGHSKICCSGRTSGSASPTRHPRA